MPRSARHSLIPALSIYATLLIILTTLAIVLNVNNSISGEPHGFAVLGLSIGFLLFFGFSVPIRHAANQRLKLAKGFLEDLGVHYGWDPSDVKKVLQMEKSLLVATEATRETFFTLLNDAILDDRFNVDATKIFEAAENITAPAGAQR